MEEIIRADGLTKTYGTRVAVDHIDFTVHRGDCFGFLGPNGAGKTTTLLMMMGLATISAGSLRIFGKPVPAEQKLVKRRIGVVPQTDSLDPDLTVFENLFVYGRYFGMERRRITARAEELLDFFALSGRRSEIISHLSGGQRRRLLLARALIHDPDLLILDEPTVGLDPQARSLIWQRLHDLLQKGKTMLLTSHYMDEVAHLSNKVLIIDHGKVVVEGKPQQLISDLVGVDVYEVNGSSGDLDRLASQAASCRATVERTETGLLVYSRGDCHELDEKVRQMPGWLRRPANLEDLFLLLTGRILRE